MGTTLHLIYDGKVFLPEDPVNLRPDTRVRATIETTEPLKRKDTSFLETARALRIDGPPDWAARLEDYLYPRQANENE